MDTSDGQGDVHVTDPSSVQGKDQSTRHHLRPESATQPNAMLAHRELDITDREDGHTRPITEDENNEYSLAEKLRAHLDIDLETDAGIMKDMGDLYRRRGKMSKEPWCFVKASALYNAAGIRTHGIDLQHAIKECIEANERQICNLFGVLYTRNLPLVYTNIHKDQLSKIRERIAEKTTTILKYFDINYKVEIENDEKRIEIEKEIVGKVKDIFDEITADMTKYCKILMSKTKGILGTPPQEYSILGLGSLARHEMTPYSDLEFIILTENDSAMDYFRNFVHLLHIFVLNLGESQLPSIGIKSLNDFDKEGGNWFYDTQARCGFMFDGAAPWACRTPLGRPDRLRMDGSTKEGIELIQTPEKMASLCQTDIAIKEGYNISKIIMSVCVIDQSEKGEELFQRFIRKRDELTCSDEYKKHIFELLKTDVKAFSEKLNFRFLDTNNDNTLHNIKQDAYRLPTLMVNSFKPLFALKGTTAWDILDQMCERSVIFSKAAHNLKVAVSIAALLRLHTYNLRKGQKETISLLKPNERMLDLDASTSRTALGKTIANVPTFKLPLLRFYMTAVPLAEFFARIPSFEEYVEKEGYLGMVLFENSDYVKGIFEYNCMNFENARDCLIRAVENQQGADTKSLAALYLFIGHAGLKIRSFEEALCYYQKALGICIDGHLNEGYIAVCYGSIGSVYKAKLDLKNALHYYELQLKLHGNSINSNVTRCLNNIGDAYRLTGELGKALDYHKRSYEMALQKRSDCNNSDVAVSLNSIGVVYRIMGDYDNALKHHMQTYQMILEIHGNSIHSDIAVSLNNIGEVYHAKCDYGNALKYHLQSLEMKQHMYKNSDVGSLLYSIGKAYHAKGDYDNALKYHLQSYELELQIHGNQGRGGVTVSLNTIGQVYLAKGGHENALKYHLQAYELELKMHGGSNHCDVATCLSHIGRVYSATGDHDKALEYHTKSHDIELKMHDGSTHFDVAVSLNNIGEVYRDKGDTDNALTYHMQSMQTRLQIYGNSNNGAVARSLYNIGKVYRDKGDTDIALKYHIQSYEMRLQIHGEMNHIDVARSLYNIGEVYRAKGDHDNALTHHVRAYEMRLQIHGDISHSDVAMSLKVVEDLHSVESIK